MTDNANELDIEILKDLEPISLLSNDYIEELMNESSVEHLKTGASVFDNGNAHTQAVYLINGSLEVTSNEKDTKRVIESGTEEARHPITDGLSGALSAITTSDVDIIRIDKEFLDTLLTWGNISAPETEVVMSADGIMTIDKGSWLKLMLKSPTFRKLPPANIEQLLTRLEPYKVKAGDTIIKQGDAGDYFYMINEGSVMVTHSPENDEDSIEMAELNEGSSFGEAALISDNPRNATVSMMSDGVLLRLSKEDFIKLLKQPSIESLAYKKACKKIGKGAKWIDVRMPQEFAHSHLPDAINIPSKDLHKQARNLDPSTLYICYCQTGRRSSAAIFVLKQYRFKAVMLESGLDDVPSKDMTTTQQAIGE